MSFSFADEQDPFEQYTRQDQGAPPPDTDNAVEQLGLLVQSSQRQTQLLDKMCSLLEGLETKVDRLVSVQSALGSGGAGGNAPGRGQEGATGGGGRGKVLAPPARTVEGGSRGGMPQDLRTKAERMAAERARAEEESRLREEAKREEARRKKEEEERKRLEAERQRQEEQERKEKLEQKTNGLMSNLIVGSGSGGLFDEAPVRRNKGGLFDD